MSEFKTCFTKILNIEPHPDKETTALEIATVYGFQIVVRKDSMKIGDTVFYIPIDAILNTEIEELIFPKTSKVKLSGGRVRQIRLRKYPSQGLLVESKLIMDYLESKGFNQKMVIIELDKDMSSLVGICKYEPEPPKEHTGTPITSKRRLAEHPQFHGYNGLDNLKWGDPFELGELVSIQLKLHGTNARFGNLKKTPKTVFEKILKFLRLLPEYETRYGSNKVDITAKNGASGFYETDVYGTAFKRVDAAKKVRPNEVIYGEIIGEGIQKNYHYGHKVPHFVLFDVKVFREDGSNYWLNPKEVAEYAKERGFEMIPELFYGDYTKEIAKTLVSGADPYYPAHKVREGIVIKSVTNYNDPMSSSSKKARKMISPEYLDDKSNTDNH